MTKRKGEHKELFFKTNKRLTRETTLIAQIEKEIKGGYVTLAAIALFIDEEGRAFPSQSELAKQVGVSRQTINARIKALIEFTTKDGQKVLEAKTVREGLNKTRTFYRLLPASGLTYIHDVSNEVVESALQANDEEATNEVVNDTLQRQEVAEHCEENTEGVKSALQPIVKKSDRLSSGFDPKKNSVITKSIQEEFSNNNNHKGNADIVENKNKSLIKDNNNIDNESTIVAKEKDSHKAIKEKLKEVETDIVEDTERKRIAAVIVANGRRNSNIKEDGSQAAHVGGVASKQSTKDKVLPKATMSRSMERATILAMVESNRKAREASEIKAREERRKKAREEVAAITRMTAHQDDMASESISKDKRLSVQGIPNTEQHGTSIEDDGQSFEDLVRDLLG